MLSVLQNIFTARALRLGVQRWAVSATTKVSVLHELYDSMYSSEQWALQPGTTCTSRALWRSVQQWTMSVTTKVSVRHKLCNSVYSNEQRVLQARRLYRTSITTQSTAVSSERSNQGICTVLQEFYDLVYSNEQWALQPRYLYCTRFTTWCTEVSSERFNPGICTAQALRLGVQQLEAKQSVSILIYKYSV